MSLVNRVCSSLILQVHEITMAANSKRKKSKGKVFKVMATMFVLFFAIGLYLFFLPNTGAFSQDEFLYIRTGSTYDEVKLALKEQGFVKNINSFDLLAKNAGLKDKILAGKYKIDKGMSNYNIVRLLRSGKQSPVRLVITKLRTKEDFIRLVSKQLEADSNVMKHIFSDANFLSQYGLDTNTAMCAIMPDTYEFYWNSSAEKVFRKIAAKYVAFWTEERKNKASQLALTPQEVISLASIVEEESNKNDERPTIASVYINRLRKGMKLQADPTARFAYGDFMIKRITGVHTSVESPYNTYKVEGLPPGPICTPSEKCITAVLNAPKNNYLYFCAKEDFSGYHNFASTLQEHNANARKYHIALNARGIK